MNWTCTRCDMPATYACDCRTLLCDDHQSIESRDHSNHGLSELATYSSHEVNVIKQELNTIQRAVIARVLDPLNQKLKGLFKEINKVYQEKTNQLREVRTRVNSISIAVSQLESPSKNSQLTPELLFLLSRPRNCPRSQELALELASMFIEPLFRKETPVLVCPANKKLKLYSSADIEQFLEEPKILPESRCLLLNSNSLLVTGCGDSRQEVLRVELDSLRVSNSIAPTNDKRLNHAMTFIGRFPAVLGGEGAHTSVEVFNGTNWEIIEPMNKKRAHLTAFCLHGTSYVIGGTESHFDLEMYQRNRWIELKQGFPYRIISPSVYKPTEQSCFIFGGKNKDNTDEISIWFASNRAPRIFPPVPFDRNISNDWFWRGNQKILGYPASGPVRTVTIPMLPEN